MAERRLQAGAGPARLDRSAVTVIGASSVEQLDTNLDALSAPPLTDAELAVIDEYAVESGVNLWARSSRE